MRDRYVLQVLLATLGCALLMGLIAVVDPAWDAVKPDASAASASSTFTIKPIAAPSQTAIASPAASLIPSKPSQKSRSGRQARERLRTQADADATFYVTASKPQGHFLHCPHRDLSETEACKESGPAKPGQTKHC